MKYLPLIWSGIWRRRGRAVLMLLQIATSFLLFGLLQGFNSGIKHAIAQAHADRLFVTSSVSTGDVLPISQLSRIRSIAGVKLVTPLVQFPSTYQNLRQGIVVTAIDPDAFLGIMTDWTFSPQAATALKSSRTAALVGKVVAERYGLKVGEQLTVQSPILRQDGSNGWVFDLVGTYDVPNQPASATQLIVNYDFVNEARLANRDTTMVYYLLTRDVASAPGVGLAIDNAFANSSHETRTQSEGDLYTSQIQRIADLDYLVGIILGAVLFALLFATAALMMQSIRERLPELAVLKTVGFSDRRVMTLILFEAVTFCVFAAAIGLGIAALLLPLARSQIGISGMPWVVVLAGLACAVALALIGGSVPAHRGLKLQVAQALTER